MCIYICVYTDTYLCMCIYIYIRAHIDVHTYTTRNPTAILTWFFCPHRSMSGLVAIGLRHCGRRHLKAKAKAHDLHLPQKPSTNTMRALAFCIGNYSHCYSLGLGISQGTRYDIPIESYGIACHGTLWHGIRNRPMGLQGITMPSFLGSRCTCCPSGYKDHERVFGPYTLLESQ